MSNNKVIKICDYFIEYGILAIVFFTPVLFDFTLSNLNAFDLLKAVVFRVILSLILLAYTARVFISGKISYRGGNKIFLLLLFLLISFFLSSFFSASPTASFWGSYERTQGFYNLANYLLFFVLLILNVKSLKQIKRIVAAVILTGALVSLYGLFQLFGLDGLPWKESGFATGRIFSSLGQPNFFGQYLIMIIPLTLYGIFFVAKRFLTRFFIFLVVLAELICLVNTYSRAAWLGLSAAAALFILIYLLIKKQKRTATSFIIIILVSAGLILGLSFFKSSSSSGGLYQTNFINRLKSITDLNSGSNKMRLYYWQAATQEIRQENVQRLIFGYGPDALPDVFVKYYQSDWAIYEVINTFADRAHNWPLDIILSYGFLGLTVILLFFIYIIIKAINFLFGQEVGAPDEIWLAVALLSGLAAYSVNNLFSFSLFTCFVYLYLITAILWFLVGGREDKQIKLKFMSASKILIWLALACVAGLYLYLYNINSVRADHYYVLAKKAQKKGDCRGVLNNMEKATAYAPSSVYYKEQYIFYGLNCLPAITSATSRFDLRNNILAQLKLIKPKDYDYNVRLTVARAQSLFGYYIDQADYAPAEKIFKDLISRYPMLLTSYQDLGRMKMWQKDFAAALKLFNQAEEILPPLNNPQLNQNHRQEISAEAVNLYEKMGYSYNKLKNYNLASKYYREALGLDPYRLTLYKNLADVYYAQGELTRAIALNQRGFILNSNDYHWPLQLSLLYREKKDLPEAKKYLNKALELAPENQDLKKYYKELNK